MRRFALLNEHLALLRRMNVGWDDRMCGAPAVDAKRPYGNSDYLNDIAGILGMELFEDDQGEHHLTRAQAARIEQVHRETEVALQIVLATGTFMPGVYVAGDYTDDWRLAAP